MSKVHTYEFTTHENPLASIPDQQNVSDDELDFGDKIIRSSKQLSSRLSVAFKSIIEDNKRVTQERTTITADRTGFENEQDSVKISQILQLVSLSPNFKVAFIHKGGCLIYIAISKN